MASSPSSKKTLWVDIILCFVMYILAIASIFNNSTFNAFLFGQLGCAWFFITLFSETKKFFKKRPREVILKDENESGKQETIHDSPRTQ